MTPTEKDAMALAVLDNCCCILPMFAALDGLNYSRADLIEARAHLASRIAELEAERQSLLLQVEAARMESSALKDRRSTLLNECDSLEARATRAEAELAAVRAYRDAVMNGVEVYEALDKRATVRTSTENVSDVLDAVARVARAATDAARGGE